MTSNQWKMAIEGMFVGIILALIICGLDMYVY